MSSVGGDEAGGGEGGGGKGGGVGRRVLGRKGCVWKYWHGFDPVRRAEEKAVTDAWQVSSVC